MVPNQTIKQRLIWTHSITKGVVQLYSHLDTHMDPATHLRDQHPQQISPITAVQPASRRPSHYTHAPPPWWHMRKHILTCTHIGCYVYHDESVPVLHDASNAWESIFPHLRRRVANPIARQLTSRTKWDPSGRWQTQDASEI